MTRRAVSAPARWPAKRGKPREVAHRPLPSEMMATWNCGAWARTSRAPLGSRTVISFIYIFLLQRKKTTRKLVCNTKCQYKKISRSPLPRRPNKCFHMIQIALQCLPPCRRQTVFRFRKAPVEGFRAHDVISLFQLARVHAQVAVGCFQQCLQFIERERAVDRQRADNTQADALMNQAIEIWRPGFRGPPPDGLQGIVPLTQPLRPFLTCCRRLSHANSRYCRSDLFEQIPSKMLFPYSRPNPWTVILASTVRTALASIMSRDPPAKSNL